MAIAMDESVRDQLVENSPYFARFVQIFSIIKYRIWRNKSFSSEKKKQKNKIWEEQSIKTSS